MTDEPISIFQDLEELEKEKQIFFLWRKIRVGRNLFAGIAIINAFVFLYTWTTAYFDIYQLAITTIFAGSYFLIKKKPYASLMTGTIIYIVMFPLYLYTMHYNPIEKTFRFPGVGETFGFIIRIAIIIYLVKGIIAAKKYETILKN